MRPWLLLALVVAAGAGLRVAHLSRASVEHFDEGVYASNVWFDEAQDNRYPNRHLYAPPLVPGLIEWSLLLSDMWRGAAMLPGLLAGCATVAVVGIVGWRWFGYRAGLSAAVLSAMSDAHVLYSRTALTDAPLCLFVLLAVFFIWSAYRTGALRVVVLAGICTALAWWTKYNGWLPLAIGLVAPILWWVVKWHGATDTRRVIVCWLAIAAIAAVLWSPVLMGLQSYGGYASVAANHRGYVVSISEWPATLARQVANYRWFDGWLSCAGLAVAALAVPIASRVGLSLASNPSRRIKVPSALIAAIGIGTLAGASAAILGSVVVLAITGAAGIGWGLATALRVDPGDETARARSLAVCLLAAWFCGLVVATPFYHPYPRLALPWLVASWLATGLLVERAGRWLDDRVGASTQARRRGDRSRRASPRCRIALGGACMAVALASVMAVGLAGRRLNERGVVGWQSRAGFESVAQRTAVDAGRVAVKEYRSGPGDVMVYVYGEPALFFHLRSRGISLTGPVQDLSFAESYTAEFPIPVFLAVGPRADDTAAFPAQWAGYGDRFQLVATYDYRPSDLVLLNEYSPWELAARADRPLAKVRLYRLMPAPRDKD